ncbi:transposase [Rhizobium gallicum]|uniref:transposase n=1 Tax=Rhizobium gallicum TaxID=56730 RepID=UPI001EF7D930|nr:transposase [Rhizobium gallicum]ULJ73088.1 transposase [Rhizobium gallicum]
MNGAFRFQGREIEVKRLNGKWSAARLPKIGWVKFRDTRRLRGKTMNVTVSLAANGWHIAFACEIDHAVPQNDLPAVGIDRGVANTLTLSTGEHWWMPAGLAEIEPRKRRAQRVLARRKRGSRRHAKARRRVAALQAVLPASGRIGGTRPVLISPVASQRSCWKTSPRAT